MIRREVIAGKSFAAKSSIAPAQRQGPGGHSMADKVDEVLARFPGPVVLPPSRRKWLLVMLICGAFTASGLFLMPRGEVKTWLTVAFFGLGTAVSITMLLPGAGGLTLSREGFKVTSLFRSHFVVWAQATDFMAHRIPPAMKQMVLYNDAGAKHGTLGKINTGLTGRNGALPDTYGMRADALAALMSKWRERALR
jgi:hypothetical protein